MSENTILEEKTASPSEAKSTIEQSIETPEIPETEPAEKKPLFRFRSKNNDSFSRDEWILSNINNEDLMDYLKLEQKRLELLQTAKDVRGKRILTAFELTVSLAAVTAITYFLKDNPTILISILYTVGIISALLLLKKPTDKK